jgi:hypothetical protein
MPPTGISHPRTWIFVRRFTKPRSPRRLCAMSYQNAGADRRADTTGRDQPPRSMSEFYANIIIAGPTQADVTMALNDARQVAYVAGQAQGGVVVFHEHLAGQEQLARDLSARFECPVLLAMVFGGSVLLYHLYVSGAQADAYVSTPHEGLELDGPPPHGNAETLCAAFGMEHRAASLQRTLNRPTKPDTDYAYAVNRHGELLRALGLPLFAAGTGFAAIEAGELPHAPGFDPSTLVRTGS